MPEPLDIPPFPSTPERADAARDFSAVMIRQWATLPSDFVFRGDLRERAQVIANQCAGEILARTGGSARILPVNVDDGREPDPRLFFYAFMRQSGDKGQNVDPRSLTGPVSLAGLVMVIPDSGCYNLEVANLFVAQPLRGQGVGAALMWGALHAAQSSMRQCGRERASVKLVNSRGDGGKYYALFGFQFAGMQDGLPIMRRPLRTAEQLPGLAPF